MFRLDGKIALVTGGSRGIGRAICRGLANQGATVVVNYLRDEAAASSLVSELTALGVQAESLQFDVADSAQTDGAISDLVKRMGRLDILIANAGIAVDGLLLRMKDEDLDRVLAVNLRGAVASARAAVRTMIRARAGRIVFVSSVIGERGNAGQAAYAASKAALLGLTRTLAREYASRGVTVNAVTPGLIETDMTAKLDEAAREAARALIPLGRLGVPDDVAAPVVFLCTDEAAYITGSTVRVNGGMYV